jgi:hypothetical protein
MNYEKLISTVSEIIENEKIEKKGLILNYELSEKTHKQMNEDLFFRMNSSDTVFRPTDIFEVEIDGMLIKFTKKLETHNEQIDTMVEI